MKEMTKPTFTDAEKRQMEIDSDNAIADYYASVKKTHKDLAHSLHLASLIEGIRLDLNDELPDQTVLPVKASEPAVSFLEEAAETMKARAALRDKPSGERTAKKIAEVFNAITGHHLTEADAWMFLIVLKIVRSRSGKYNRDDYVDGSAYMSLLGEHESTSRG